MLYRLTDRLCRCGAAVKNLAHSASFQSLENNAPSNPGIKHLERAQGSSLSRGEISKIVSPSAYERRFLWPAASASMDTTIFLRLPQSIASDRWRSITAPAPLTSLQHGRS